MPAPKGNKNARGNRGGGAKPLYKPEYADMAHKISLLGATDAELAACIGVSETTINTWKRDHIEFFEAQTRGKMVADANVAEKLYHRALGYSHNAVKIFQVDGAPLIVPYTEHYPPDTPAASLWLRNRQPAKWRDKQDHEVTGKDGAPLVEPDRLELTRRIALMFLSALPGLEKKDPS